MQLVCSALYPLYPVCWSEGYARARVTAACAMRIMGRAMPAAVMAYYIWKVVSVVAGRWPLARCCWFKNAQARERRWQSVM